MDFPSVNDLDKIERTGIYRSSPENNAPIVNGYAVIMVQEKLSRRVVFDTTGKIVLNQIKEKHGSKWFDVKYV